MTQEQAEAVDVPTEHEPATPEPATPEPTEAPSRLPQRLLDGRIVVAFGSDATGSLVGALEVMVQEGIGVFSMPASRAADLGNLAVMFGPRASFGVHGVTAETLDDALATPAEVIELRTPDAALVERIHEAGRAALVAALTPTEIAHAWSLGADAVVVVPAEVMGSSYPEQLVELLPGVALAARSGLGAYSARRWVEAGASFVCLDDALIGDAAKGGSLSGLRERCQTFVTSVQ